MNIPTKPRWIEINTNLKKCRKIARILKRKNTELKLPIRKNTIVPYRKNSKYEKHRIRAPSRTMLAHCHWSGDFQPDKKPHICIKQRFLYWPIVSPTHTDYGRGGISDKLFPGWSWLEGNFALMDIMCHELSHLIELGHGKKFLKLYLKYLSQMAESIISGEFYR